MSKRVLLTRKQLELTINRLCYQLIEKHNDFSNTVVIGVQPRGVEFSRKILNRLKEINPTINPPYGNLDITFHRDDFRTHIEPLNPNTTDIDFLIENKNVVLIDDVLYTGRTIRAAMDAMLAFGRPLNVELMVLIDRRFARHLPIEPNYVGKTVDSIQSEKVKVEWEELHKKEQVLLLPIE